MSSPAARIANLASAVPAALDHRELWEDYFAARFAGDTRAARLWAAAGVRTRHGALDPRVEDVTGWSTGARMQRFMTEAVPLGKEAVSGVLGRLDVGLLAVASCTGYATPGLDIVLARDLALPPDVQRLAIGHMGCYAALPGLLAASDFARSRSAAAVLLCCELPSLHAQVLEDAHTTGGLEQLVAHSLFADAAAAVSVVPGDQPDLAPGLEIVDSEVATDTGSAALMTWEVTDTGFRMGLSPRVPRVLATHLRPTLDRLLARHGAVVGDVAGWAVHPGGPRILDVVQSECALSRQDLSISRGVLADYGNCSSPTVLMVLQQMLAVRSFAPGDLVVLLAFGPGLTLYSVLARWAR